MPQIQFGFPDFWDEFTERFGPVLQCLKGVEQALNGLVDRRWDAVDGQQRVILNLTRLNGVAMEELIILAANGCGHGAMKILRSILETTIDAHYLRRFPPTFSDHLDWGHIARWKLYQSLKRHAPDAYVAIGEPERQRVERELANLRTRFTNARTGKLRARWCGIDLGAEAEKAGLGEIYGLINPPASQMLHGNMFGLELHFQPSVDLHRIDVPPSMKWCREALFGGHICLVKSVGAFAEAMATESEPTVGELENQHKLVWNSITDSGTATPSP